jgi:hypothetical protein
MRLSHLVAFIPRIESWQVVSAKDALIPASGGIRRAVAEKPYGLDSRTSLSLFFAHFRFCHIFPLHKSQSAQVNCGIVGQAGLGYGHMRSMQSRDADS